MNNINKNITYCSRFFGSTQPVWTENLIAKAIVTETHKTVEFRYNIDDLIMIGLFYDA